MSSVELLLTGLLAGMGLGAWLRSSAVRAQRQSDAENRERWLALREVLWTLPQLPDDAAKIEAVEDGVAHTTSFRAQLLLAEGGHITDDQIAAAPFFVEPHLVGMAMRQRQQISSASLAPLGWGCAYIPLCYGAQVWGVLVLAKAESGLWRPEELACCDILAQSLGANLSAAMALKV